MSVIISVGKIGCYSYKMSRIQKGTNLSTVYLSIRNVAKQLKEESLWGMQLTNKKSRNL